MNIQNKPIAFLQDSEIIELLGVCAELFGTQLREYGLQAFIYLLKQKYNFTTDKKILDSCTNFAASQAQGKRFSPAFLSYILTNENKEQKTHGDYETHEITDEEKAFYKQEFLEVVYMDFDDYCNKIPPSRILMWRLVCRQLIKAGIIEQTKYDEVNLRTENKKSDVRNVMQIFSFENEFKKLCLKGFYMIAMRGEHISKYVK